MEAARFSGTITNLNDREIDTVASNFVDGFFEHGRALRASRSKTRHAFAQTARRRVAGARTTARVVRVSDRARVWRPEPPKSA